MWAQSGLVCPAMWQTGGLLPARPLLGTATDSVPLLSLLQPYVCQQQVTCGHCSASWR